ncbi:MAG TPA: hemerythrin domain-containing protein [Steroidobacteraceae bacterium]|nr:hemerythrin domain-containing protein [Steroidobacteraceae bacterium]
MYSLDRRRAFGLIAAVLTAPHMRIAGAGEEKEVEAAEDLMREHGVLRRALLVYAEAASRLSTSRGEVPTTALRDAAALFRTFGEDYHERSLEEKHVFPKMLEQGGANAALSKVLREQHDRGREITDYIAAVTGRGRVSPADIPRFVEALTSFVRMYEHHAAIEDTVLFPAWKAALSQSQYHELSEQFEELEHRMFGKDGFDDAVERIVRIEQAFGLADLAKLTAPSPPRPAA